MQLIVQLENGVMNTRCVILCHAHHGTRPWSQCWIGLIWSQPERLLLWLRIPYAPRASENVSVGRCPASERIQAVQHWLEVLLCESRCLVDRVQLHTEKRDPLHRGELPFSQLNRSPNRLRWRSTMSLGLQQLVPRLCQYQPVVEIVKNANAAFSERNNCCLRDFREECEATGTARRVGPCTDTPRITNANRRNGLCRRRIETWK